MKHAYLIIAHNEFVVLEKLIETLDDERVDIFILFDKKIEVIPKLEVNRASLFILENRINIFWGHSSQIEAEMILFDAVFNRDYRYCHLISGVHLPLYSQDFLHDYFNKTYPKQVFLDLPFHPFEIQMKVQAKSFFIQYYRHPNIALSKLAQFCWVFFLKIQRWLNIDRQYYHEYIKYSNWVCITQDAVNYLVNNKFNIRHNFKYTFCADEFFVPTVLKNANIPFEFLIEDKLLYQNFDNTGATVLNAQDFDALMNSKALFGRKFSLASIELVNRVIANYKIR